MVFIKVLVIFTVVILYNKSNINASEIKTLTWQSNFVTTIPNVTSFSSTIKNTTIAYAVCFSGIEKMCTLTAQTITHDNVPYEEICEINVKPNGSDEIFSTLEVQLFGKTKIILYWLEKNSTSKVGYFSIVNLRMLIVNFPECSMNSVDIKINTYVYESYLKEIKNINIVDFKDKFDVFYFNEQNVYKKSTYNSKGDQINNIIWSPVIGHNGANAVVFNLNPYFDKSDYFVVQSSYVISELSIVYNNGTVKKLREFDNKTNSFVVSTANNMISYCHSLQSLYAWKSINCSQFDSNINQLFNYKLNFGYTAEQLHTYNLPNGGLLIASRNNVLSHSNSSYFISVTKVDSKHRYKSLKILGSNCKSKDLLMTDIFEIDEENYCILLRCFDDQLSKIVTKCFPEKLINIPV